jgi:hypothetical protein
MCIPLDAGMFWWVKIEKEDRLLCKLAYHFNQTNDRRLVEKAGVSMLILLIRN